MFTFTSNIGRGATFLLDKIVWAMAASRIPPNVFTGLGIAIGAAAAFAFGYGHFFLGGWIIVGLGLFDMLDGRVARVTHNVTAFGGFFDSVVDRYADMAVYFGLLVYYARLNRLHYVVLVALAMTGSVMVSYSRARAESLIQTCKVGFMERPERIVLIIIGGLFNRMAACLWVIAVISNITVIHRIVYTWQQTKQVQSSIPRPEPVQSPKSKVQTR